MQASIKNILVSGLCALILSLCSMTGNTMAAQTGSTLSTVPAGSAPSPNMRTALNTGQVKTIAQGRSDLKEVALTFDDGPSALYTQQVITILQQYHVPATFFALGQNASRYPGLVKEERANGFATENHSWNHADLTKLDATALDNELARTSATIQQTSGVAPTLMRPPYGALNTTVKDAIVAHGMTPVLWNIDTEDWQLPGSTAIANTALTHTQNGAIILMHDGGGDRTQTVAALPSIITGLQKQGYQLVTVPQLIGA